MIIKQTSHIIMENNKQINVGWDELSNRLLPSHWKITNKSMTGAIIYQTDFFHPNRNKKQIYHRCDELSKDTLHRNGK